MDDYPKCQCTWKKGKPVGIPCKKPARHFIKFKDHNLLLQEKNTKDGCDFCGQKFHRNNSCISMFLGGIIKEAYTCSEHLTIYEHNAEILTTECVHAAWRNRQRQNDAGQS